MNNNEILIDNLGKLHTTKMGIERIRKNLCIDVDDVVSYCKQMIENPNSCITREGKNWYIVAGDSKITVNVYSYTIITAHKIKK